jgi:hypothetical protein
MFDARRERPRHMAASVQRFAFFARGGFFDRSAFLPGEVQR